MGENINDREAGNRAVLLVTIEDVSSYGEGCKCSLIEKY